MSPYWELWWHGKNKTKKPKNKTEQYENQYYLINKTVPEPSVPPEVLQIIYVFNKYTQPSQNKIQWS